MVIAVMLSKSFMKILEEYLRRIFTNFFLPCATFLLKMSSFKDIFQGFFRNPFSFFGDWENIYMAEHFLMTASACSWEIM